jgi:hypothetical protein
MSDQRNFEERVKDRIEGEGGIPRSEVVYWRCSQTPLPFVGARVTLPDGREGRVLTAKPADDRRDTKLTVRTNRTNPPPNQPNTEEGR